MRAFAFIFNFYILLLAVYPAFNSAGTSNKSGNTRTVCCQKMKCPKQEGPKETRTPFFRCPYIQVTTLAIEEITIAEIAVFRTKYSYFNESPDKVIASSPWHPPKA